MPPQNAFSGTAQFGRFVGNPLGFLSKLADDGRDLVPFQLLSLPGFLVTKPEYIKQGLQNEDWPPLSRGRLLGILEWYDAGLFVTFGEAHHEQRDMLWRPVLDDASILDLAVEEAARWAEGWRDGEEIEAWDDHRRLVYMIDWRVLAGDRLEDHAGVYDWLVTGVEWLPRLLLPFGRRRFNLSTPEGRKARDHKRRLDSLLDSMLAAARRNGDASGALPRLSRSADEIGISHEDLRATVKMYFGADQLHALFVWTWYLLAQNPEAEAKLHEELDRELGGRPPSPGDIERLSYLRNVLKESMRVYPPVFGFFRQVVERDYSFDGQVVPAGSLIGFSPWVTHRDSRYWPDPMRFDPDRWSPDAPKPPEVSYFPFSSGPYMCHGASLAMKEAVLIMATLAQRWRLRPASAKPPKATATWATEPKGGLRMTAHARA